MTKTAMPFQGSHVIDPHVMRAIPHLLPSACTLLHIIFEYNEFNEPIPREVADPLMTAIPCYVEKNTTGNDEIDRPSQVVVTGAYACVLGGYYPSIDRKHTAYIDGVRYDIVDIANDDFHTMTILGLERVNKDTEIDYSDAPADV